MQTKCNVARNAKVRKQSVVLKNHAHAAVFGGRRSARLAHNAVRQLNEPSRHRL